jgi:hypothetical protein
MLHVADELGIPCMSSDIPSGSAAPVEVVIPAILKDLDLLPYVVASIRANLRHKVTAISVVSPANPEIENFCKLGGLSFVNESEILPIQKMDIRYDVRGLDRSGWLYQQLLKFACILKAQTEWVFIADADTILVRPLGFFDDKTLVFDIPLENTKPYKDAVKALLGIQAVTGLSFVAHHIMTNQKVTRELLAAIEQRTGKSWIESICALVSPTEASCFSEYDLIGNFWVHRYPDKVAFRNWLNGSYTRSQCAMLKQPWIRLFYRTLSFHSYNG